MEAASESVVQGNVDYILPSLISVVKFFVHSSRWGALGRKERRVMGGETGSMFLLPTFHFFPSLFFFRSPSTTNLQAISSPALLLPPSSTPPSLSLLSLSLSFSLAVQLVSHSPNSYPLVKNSSSLDLKASPTGLYNTTRHDMLTQCRFPSYSSTLIDIFTKRATIIPSTSSTRYSGSHQTTHPHRQSKDLWPCRNCCVQYLCNTLSNKPALSEGCPIPLTLDFFYFFIPPPPNA